MKTPNPQRSLVLAMVLAAGLASHCSAQTYFDEVIADGPASYWRLGELFPPVPSDIAFNLGALGPSADASYLGGVNHPVPGALIASTNPAARFPVGGARVQAAYLEALNPTGPFTVEAWLKPSAALSGGDLTTALASGHFASPRSGWLIYQAPSGWNFRTYNQNGLSTALNIIGGPAPVVGQWSYVVAVWDGTRGYVYVNGTLANTSPATTFVANTDGNFTIGVRSDLGFPWAGTADEVAFYSTALTASQIAAHYENATNEAPAQPYEEIVLTDEPRSYWRLDESPPPPTTVQATNQGTLGDPENGSYRGQVASGQPGALIDDSNTAAGFNGTNAFVEAPYNAANNGPPAFSVECWARVIGAQNNYRFAVASSDDPGGDTRGYFLHASNSNRWEFWTGFGATAANSWYVSRGPSVQLGEWAHLVGTYDGTYKSLYVNGTLYNVFDLPVSNNITSPLTIGSGASSSTRGFYFPGDVDEVAVYPTVLSPNRVAAHYFAARGSNPPPVTPAIALQPQGFTNYVGGSGSLTVIVLGTPPFTFQWRHDGTDVLDATNATLTITNALESDSGEYDVLIDTAGGGGPSGTATVLIKPDDIPTIVQQPQNVTTYEGLTASFSVKATGSLRFTYQWLRESVDIPDATNSTLFIPNVTGADAGEFNVRVTNGNGESTDSESAILTVLPTPPPGSYPSGIVSSNLPIGYWRLGEEVGTATAYDYVGGHNGVYNNVALGLPGAIVGDDNTAGGFDPAQESRVTVADPAVFNFTGTTPFSLEGWVKFDALPAAGTVARLFSNRQVVGGAAGYGFGVLGDTTIRFTAFGIVDADRTVATLQTNQWYHLVAVRSGTSVQLYLNGVPAGLPLAVNNVASSDQPLQFGRNPDVGNGEEEVAGTLDEFTVYDRPLTALEVCDHYLTGRAIVLDLTITLTGSDVTVGWPIGTLEGANSVTGPWQPITNGVNSVTLPASQAYQFFRARKP